MRMGEHGCVTDACEGMQRYTHAGGCTWMHIRYQALGTYIHTCVHTCIRLEGWFFGKVIKSLWEVDIEYV